MILYAIACFLSGSASALILLQGRHQVAVGQLILLCTTTAFIWFSLRLFRLAIKSGFAQSILSILAALLCTYLLAVSGLYFFQNRFLFVPVGGRFSLCKQADLHGYKKVHEQLGTTPIRFLLKMNPKAVGWVIVFHGNAESACDAVENYGEMLGTFSLNVVLAEYPGYGEPDVRSSQKSLADNTLAVFDFIQKENHSSLPVLAFGRSLGTGFATYLASERKVDGLVLISPFTSIADVAAHQYPFIPVNALLRDPIPASDWASRVTAPVFIIHGILDGVIPIAIGRSEAKKFVNLRGMNEVVGAGHNDILEAPTVWDSIGAFITKTLALPKGSSSK